MLKVDEIKAAMEELPEKDFAQLRHWFSEKDWQKWNREIEVDSKSGRLDFLIEEASFEKSEGEFKEL